MWRAVSGAKAQPVNNDGGAQTDFDKRKDKALATNILPVDLSLLYLLPDSQCPREVWTKLEEVAAENLDEEATVQEEGLFTKPGCRKVSASILLRNTSDKSNNRFAVTHMCMRYPDKHTPRTRSRM